MPLPAGFEFVREDAARASAAVNSGCSPCSMVAASSRPASSSILHEASYELTYGARGARVAFVASEPITATSADWVAVPKNTALVITREKGGFINVLRSALNPNAAQPHPGPSPANPGCAGSILPSPPRPMGPQAPLTLSGTLAIPTPASPAPAAPPLPSTVPSPVARSPSPPPLWPPSHEVVVCLEALSRGLGAKSRAWLARPLGRIPSTLSFTNLIVRGGSPFANANGAGPGMSTQGSTLGLEQFVQAAVGGGLGGGGGGSLAGSPSEAGALARLFSSGFNNGSMTAGSGQGLGLSSSPSAAAPVGSLAAAAAATYARQSSSALGRGVSGGPYQATLPLSRETSQGDSELFHRSSVSFLRESSSALGGAGPGELLEGAGGIPPHAGPSLQALHGLRLPAIGASETNVHEFQRLVGHSGAVLCAVVDEVEQRLFTSSVDCTIKVGVLVGSFQIWWDWGRVRLGLELVLRCIPYCVLPGIRCA